ncbi:MAG TPA: hypothetical protein PK031_06630 [Pseudomonadales bacterium]|nr:hypothetical protein [Pseudomonadales bacterium]
MKTTARILLIFVLIFSTLFAILMAVALTNNHDAKTIALFASGLLVSVLSYLTEKHLCRKISEEDSDITKLDEYTLSFPAIKVGIAFLAFTGISVAVAQHLSLKTIYWPEDWKGVVAVIFCIILALLFGIALAFRTGKPALKIDRKGAFISGHGFIPWDAIEGIQSHYDERAGVFARFKIKDINCFLKQMDPLAKILLPIRSKSMKNVIAVKVGTRESQRAVIDLAKKLWQQSTNKKDLWHMGMSEEVLSALQRQEKLLSDLEAAADSNDPTLLKDTMEKIDSDFGILEREMKKSTKNLQIATWMAVAIPLLLIALLAAKFVLPLK